MREVLAALEPELETDPEAPSYFVPLFLMQAASEPAEEFARHYHLARGIVATGGDPTVTASFAYAVADALLSVGRAERALSILKPALQDCPTDVEPRLMLRITSAEAHRGHHDWDAALLQLAALREEAKDASADTFRTPPEVYVGMSHGVEAQVLLDMGLANEAGEHLDREGNVARAEDAPPTLRLRHLLHRCDHLIQFEGYADILELLNGEAPTIDALLPGAKGLLALQRGTALAMSAVTRESDVDPALEALNVALEVEPPTRNRALALRLVAGLRCSRGELDEAQRTLGEAYELHTALVEGSVEEDAMLAATAVRLELARLARAEGAEERDATRTGVEGARTRLATCFAAWLDEWRTVERPPGGLGFLHFAARREVAAQLVRATLAAGGDNEDAFDVLLDVQSVGSVALAGGVGRPTIAELRAELLAGDDHVVVAFLPGMRDLHVFALDRETLLHERVEGYEDTRRLAKALVSRLAGDERETENVGRTLKLCDEVGARFLPPAVRERLAKGARVTLVGLPEELPGALLGLEADRLLGEACAVDQVPSLPRALLLARRARTPIAFDGQASILIGTLQPGDDALALQPGLWRHDIEERELAPLGVRPGQPERSRFRLALDPTLADVLALDLREAPVVHVLAHGVADPRSPRRAALALRPDEHGSSLLRCADVERMELSGLVVLAACATAVGPPRAGDDDLAHLGGAFLAAGARAVVLTRSRIDYAWSVEVLGRFYDALFAGASPAEALRRARATEAGVKQEPWRRLEAGQLTVLGRGHGDPAER